MKLTDFDFDLPQDLIAQKPSGKRGDDRLMLLDRKNGSVFHHQMNDLPDLIMPGTLMIFNNSKVRRARCYGIKETTGRNQEFMFLNQLDKEGFLWNTMVKYAKKQKNGMRYQFPDGTVAQIVDFPGNEKTEFRALKFDFPLMRSPPLYYSLLVMYSNASDSVGNLIGQFGKYQSPYFM